MNEIKLIITDFDGTLVDTFEANFFAYLRAFELNKMSISREQYQACFGFRFDKFMDTMEVWDESIRHSIREIKGRIYPDYFDCLVPNKTLISFIQHFRHTGGKVAIASTAAGHNLMNVLLCLNIQDLFDLILAGEDVQSGKPNPEIFLTAMSRLGFKPEQTLVFEDSEIGFEAATAAGVLYIPINSVYFK
jgi:beta-phosphoglucomutase